MEKYDSVTGEALPGCTFQLKYLGGTSGTGGTAIGQKVTGKNGTAIWTGLQPGTYICEEVDPADGYSIIQSSETIFLADSGEQSVITVRFTNSPDGILLIRKVCSVNPSIPLQDAEFKVTYADGTLIGDSNGVYRTDAHGEIRIPTLTDLTPGTVITAKETKTVDHFVLDGTPQSITIREGESQTLTFYNAPIGGLELIKVCESDKSQRIPGVTFEIRKMDGALVDTVTTGDNGRAFKPLDAGDYYLVEIEAASGFKMDSTPHYFTIRDNAATTLTVTNQAFSGVIIHKTDAVSLKILVKDLRGKNPEVTDLTKGRVKWN